MNRNHLIIIMLYHTYKVLVIAIANNLLNTFIVKLFQNEFCHAIL
jgi:hypothetical protein